MFQSNSANRSHKKLKIQDITYYSNKRQHPFSYSKSPNPKNKHKNNSNNDNSHINNCTHDTHNTNDIIFNFSHSPSNCCAKNKGIMAQAISQRIQQYKKDYKRKFLRKTIQQMRRQSKEKQAKQLRQSPLINKQSQKLFKKVAEKRNLSPQVLVRFQQYQRSKTLRKLKMKIETYYNEKKKIPRPQQIISPQKISQLQHAKKLIDTLNSHLQKYVVHPETPKQNKNKK